MPETTVTDSSAIAYIEWDAGTLFVLMRDGSRLSYTGVPEEVYHDFADAGSKGAYFNDNIRENYGFGYG